MRSSRIGLVVVVLAMSLGVGAAGAAESKAQRAAMNRFAANNSLFVLYHEIGHMLVHQLNLPVLGREEDAADNMATWTLLRQGTPKADQALADAAQGWLLSGIAYSSEIKDEDLYGNHSLDRQRAFQIVCLMVGSNDSAFRPIANQYAIDRDRQDTCSDDYFTLNRSLEGLLGARANKSGHGTKVSVTYHDAGGDLRKAAAAFRASGVFDQVADEVRTHYSIATPLQFNAKRCGEANAFYEPETDEVIFCYELMQDFIDLYSTDKSGRLGGAAHLPGKSKSLPAPRVAEKNIDN
ncbi:MAG TPA: DUF4344 domain-containing metallopeptidase [Devosia sp.]|nr:DUF4344 domain-containing metallopeptidase [Devosia sp.]